MPHIDADNHFHVSPAVDNWVRLPATPCLSSTNNYSLPLLHIVSAGYRQHDATLREQEDQLNQFKSAAYLRRDH